MSIAPTPLASVGRGLRGNARQPKKHGKIMADGSKSWTKERAKKQRKTNTTELPSRAIGTLIKKGLDILAQKEQDKYEPREGDTWHAREVGGCLARAGFRRLGVPGDGDASGRFYDLAQRGKCLEQLAASALGAVPGSFTGVQRRLSKTFTGTGPAVTIVGRIDGEFARTPDEAAVGIEFKSVGDDTFRRLRSLEDVGRVRPEHIKQALTYCWLGGYASCFLVYICRDESVFRSFKVEYERDRFEETLHSLTPAERALQDDALPNPSPSYTCHFCPFIRKCEVWGGSFDIKAWKEQQTKSKAVSSSHHQEVRPAPQEGGGLPPLE